MKKNPVPGDVYDAALRIAADMEVVSAWAKDAGLPSKGIPVETLTLAVILAATKHGIARECVK